MEIEKDLSMGMLPKIHPTIYFASFMLVIFIFGVFMGAHQQPKQEKYFEVDVALPNGYQWEKIQYFKDDFYQISRREFRYPCCDKTPVTEGWIIAYFNTEMTRQGWVPETGSYCSAGLPERLDLHRGRSLMIYDSVEGEVCIGVLEEDDYFRVIFVTITIDREEVPPIVNYPF